MRNMVFFDLPRDSALQRRNAALFVKGLIKNGYLMMQESVYSKLIINANSIEAEKQKLQRIKPKQGNIMLLTVTEKQFNDIEILLEERVQKTIDLSDRVIFI